MALSAYETFAEAPLQFPINGKVYTLPPLGIEAGIHLANIVSGKDETFQAASGVELWKMLLGDIWEQMINDGVPLHAATRAGLTALADYQYGRETAEAAWEAGADPKALAAYIKGKGNRATRRSPSTGKATTTKPRAATNGTTSPRTSKSPKAQ